MYFWMDMFKIPCVNIEVPGDKVAPHLLHRLLLLLFVDQVHVRCKPGIFSKCIFSKKNSVRLTQAFAHQILCEPNSRESDWPPGTMMMRMMIHKDELPVLPPKTSRACTDQGREFLAAEAQNQPTGSTFYSIMIMMIMILHF